MKKLLTILSLCFVAIVVLAQNKADIIVSYDVHIPSFEKGKSEKTYQFVLLANSKESKFYCPKTEYMDSLKSTPQGLKVYNEMIMVALFGGNPSSVPSSDESSYIMKNANGSIKTYETNGSDKYTYEDSAIDWNWQVKDSSKVILGYECKEATTDFHGRKWMTWFTPEIPIQAGPWKLCGLPGLILEAWSEDNQYGFVATGLEKTNKIISNIYLSYDYEKIDRKNFLRLKRSYYDNPTGNLKSQHGSTPVLFMDENGAISNSIEYLPREEVDFIETDY